MSPVGSPVRTRRGRRRTTTTFALLGAFSLGVAACGSSSTSAATATTATPSTASSTTSSASTSTAASGVYAPARAALPASLKASGVLDVATDGTFPPYAFVQPGTTTIVGYEADFARAIAQEMGLKVVFNNMAFAGLIPAVQSGRDQIAMSGLEDTPVREKIVSLVDDLVAHNGFVIKTADKAKFTTFNDLCGQAVGDVIGSVSVTVVNDESATCKSLGKPAIIQKEFPDAGTTLTALESGQVVAQMETFPGAPYEQQQSHDALTAVPVTTGYSANFVTGEAILPSNTQLINATQIALQHLVDDGQYKTILSRYGISLQQDGATQIIVNWQTHGFTG